MYFSLNATSKECKGVYKSIVLKKWLQLNGEKGNLIKK